MVSWRRELLLVAAVCTLDAETLVAQLSTVDRDSAGTGSSVMIGADGLPLISYVATASLPFDSSLRIAHCNDPACTSATTISRVGDPYHGLGKTSIARGADGLGLVAFAGGGRLVVVHCGNLACTNPRTSTLDFGVETFFTDVGLAIGGDGLGLIAYSDYTHQRVKVAHCKDVVCGAATITTLDTSPGGGWFSSIAIGTDGRGLIAYPTGFPEDTALKVARCGGADCTTATISTIDSSSRPDEMIGAYPAIAVGPDGRGLISYLQAGTASDSEALRVAHCSDPGCSSASITTLDTAPGIAATAIAIGADGLGLVTYRRASSGTDVSLRLARCSDPGCSAATFSSVDDQNVWDSSIAMGIDGLPLISYYDSVYDDLKVAHCFEPLCTTPPTPSSFFTIHPCRLVDTRRPNGSLGGPSLIAGDDRQFRVTGPACGIPVTAKAVSLGLTVTSSTSVGNLRLHKAGTAVPPSSSVNYGAGQTRSNNAIVGLRPIGEIAVYCSQPSGTVDLILDVTGYFE